MASAFDVMVIPHGSSVYSYHLQYAFVNCPLAEYICLSEQVCMCVCVRVGCVCSCVYVYVRVRACVCVCVCACVYLCVCVCGMHVCVVCVCMYVCGCTWVRTADLHVVGPEMHHNGVILCGVANSSSSSGLSRVVETRVPWSWPCKPINGLPMYTLHAMSTLALVAQDHIIFHGSPPVTWPT